MTDYTLADKALSRAKIHLMTKPDSAFFITLCFNLNHVWDENTPKAACNGKTIFWNPDFFMGLADNDERVFLLLHETMHAAYLHMLPERVKSRNPIKWNVAADHVINLQLIARDFKMPTGKNEGLADVEYVGLSTEEVYNLLPNNPNSPPMLDLQDPGGTEKELKELGKEMEDLLVKAATQSKMMGDKPGTIPGDIEIFLDKLLNPKLPWQRILQKYMQKFSKNDYTFKRPNRRFFPKYYLPSMFSENLIDLTVAVDTSCSVDAAEFLRCISETGGILKNLKPDKITLIQFDSTIKSKTNIKSIRNLLDMTFSGRGGTNIKPVIELVNIEKPQLLLVFSDGEFRFPPGIKSTVDTLWIIHSNSRFTPPYGKVIHYTL